MKRVDILRKLRALGFILEEGTNHTKIRDQDGHFLGIVGRHNEIKERDVRNIEKQTGTKLA